ncbi:PKD domain-containing protein [Candidatus Bathyarchaeota archaeon]|nr:PKD domain-containing protein [Candidatus Bathyarchaeota archaeon]
MLKKLFIVSFILILFWFNFFYFSSSFKAAASTLITYVVEASKDDAWSKVDDVKWDTDQYYLSAPDIITGCRWRIDIPKGATIISTNFICRAKNQVNGANTTVRIEAFDQDSCDDFDTNFWGWQVMSEFVDWRLPEQFLPNTWYISTDLKTVVQAYVDRPGYTVGSYIGLRIKLQSGDAVGHEVWSWDYNPNSAAKLEINYEPPKLPVAGFSYTPEDPLINQSITFNATTSYSYNSSITKYAWNFGDATPTVNETGPIILHYYTMSGSYNVSLTVADSHGLTNSTTKTIRIRGIRQPVASFSYKPEQPVVNETVVFNASSSYDPDGAIVNYEWNFGDANITVTSETALSHIYTMHGNYNVTLTVVDNDGYSASQLHGISVNIHDIAILNVNSQDDVYIGQVVNITVTAKNEGTVTESFNVTVFRNETLIGTQLVLNLASNAELILNFQWNTSDITQTNIFLIKATADTVPGESDVLDNTYIGDTARVREVSASSFPLDWNWILITTVPPILLLVLGISWKRKNKLQKFRDFSFFDKITNGGIPDSFSVLIIGGPGSGKSVLCQQLTHTSLNQGKHCIYITYDGFPDEVRDNMGKFHWKTSNYENEGKFAFIDCFSSIAQVAKKEKYSVSQPFSLSDLGIMISKATSERASASRVFLDSTVPLLTNIDQSKVVEFLQDRSARIKGGNGTFIFTLGKETIQPNLLNRLEEVVDCVIELDISKSQEKTIRRLCIKKNAGKKRFR